MISITHRRKSAYAYLVLLSKQFYTVVKTQARKRLESNRSRYNCVVTMNEPKCFSARLAPVLPRSFLSLIMEERDITALFIGNRDCTEVKTEDIEKAVIKAINSGIRIFLNGGQGYFDRTAARAVFNLKKQYPYIQSYLLLPYRTFKGYDTSLYDEVIFPFEEHIESYYTYIGNIRKRNKKMVDAASVAIIYVRSVTGGAGKTLAYAKKKGLTIINVKEG